MMYVVIAPTSDGPSEEGLSGSEDSNAADNKARTSSSSESGLNKTASLGDRPNVGNIT